METDWSKVIDIVLASLPIVWAAAEAILRLLPTEKPASPTMRVIRGVVSILGALSDKIDRTKPTEIKEKEGMS